MQPYSDLDGYELVIDYLRAMLRMTTEGMSHEMDMPTLFETHQNLVETYEKLTEMGGKFEMSESRMMEEGKGLQIHISFKAITQIE